MKNDSKSGFSLVEMMLLLMIVSLITAGSMSVITKRHARMPQKIVHGTYMCAYNESGELYEEKFIEGKQVGQTRIIDVDAGENCLFEPPKKASYFYIQVVGAGGGGGDSGYTGGSAISASDDAYWSPLGITESFVNSNNITTEEFKSITAGYQLTAYAKGGSGGKGAQCSCHYTLETGDCHVNGSITVGVTSAACTELGGTFDPYARRAITYGGYGGSGGTCMVSASLDFGVTGSSSDGTSGTTYSANSYENSGNDGAAGTDGEACLNGSCCTAGGGAGGKHATCKTECPGGLNGGTAGAAGSDGSGNYSSTHESGIFLGNNSITTSSGKLYWKHQYKKNFVNGGEGGYAGDYKTLFVRSFNSNTLTMRPGRAGAAGTSGGNGSNGEDSILGGVLVAKGGMGGEGHLSTGYKSLPADVTGTYTYDVPDYIGRQSAFNDAANLSGMQDVQSNQMVDLSLFGKGGNGGRGTNFCWAGPHIYTFEGRELKASFHESEIECTPGHSAGTPQNGKPGAIVIVW